MTDRQKHEVGNGTAGAGGQERIKRSDALISRRKLLASLGMAGVAAATGTILGSSGFVRKAEAAGVTVLTVPNIADLKALSTAGLMANDVIYAAGYYAAGDGGGGEFYWDAASTQADNGGTVIIPSGYSGAGRWKRA